MPTIGRVVVATFVLALPRRRRSEVAEPEPETT
jgi:hypothetical protein